MKQRKMRGLSDKQLLTVLNRHANALDRHAQMISYLVQRYAPELLQPAAPAANDPAEPATV